MNETPKWAAVLLRAALACLIAIGCSTAARCDKPAFSAKALMAHVEYLASPELEGRAAGTDGERRAAEYLAKQLEAEGIGPSADGTRFQRFPVAGSHGKAESLNVIGWIGPADKNDRTATTPKPALGAMGGLSALAEEPQGVLTPHKGGQAAHGTQAQATPKATSQTTREPVIVLGAHLDHLGKTRDGRFYPGADDNASGVAIVLETAGALKRRAASLRRPVVVVFFGAEEIGLVGSRQFVQNGPIKNERMAAMINVDGVGRAVMDRSELAPIKRFLGTDLVNGLIVVGTRRRSFFAQTVESACRDAKLTPLGTQDNPALQDLFEGVSRSRADHCSFEAAGIPAIFFTSGVSDDYHRPTDTADRLLPEVMTRRAQVVFATALALATAPRDKLPPRFTPEKAKAGEAEEKVSPSASDPASSPSGRDTRFRIRPSTQRSRR